MPKRGKPDDDTLRTRGAPRKDIALRKVKPRLKQDQPLTPKQQMFVNRYLVRFNATRAYLESHPEAGVVTARSQASLLMADPRIAKQINDWVEDHNTRSSLTAEDVLRMTGNRASAKISDVYTPEGVIIPPNEMQRDVAANVKKIKRTEIMEKDADGQQVLVGHTVEIEMHDSWQPLKALGQHYKLFTERVEVVGADDLAQALREARARNAAA